MHKHRGQRAASHTLHREVRRDSSSNVCSARKDNIRRSYLVDLASSHILLSKTKPCMCKYKLFSTVKLQMAQ